MPACGLGKMERIARHVRRKRNCLGLETVPNLRAAARMLSTEDAADEEVRTALGARFPKHPLCASVPWSPTILAEQAIAVEELSPK